MVNTLQIFLILVVGVSAASAQQSSATLTLRMGAVDGPDALGRVEALAVDSVGRIYVLESDAHRVRVYSPVGESLRTIGRQGSGPGEFRSPVGMAWSPDGHLWVIDPGNSRASIFDVHGEHLEDRRLNAGFELAPWPGRFDRQGHLYHYAANARAGEFGYVMVRYDQSMNALDTIVPPQPPERPQFFETRTQRWGTIRAAVPFTPRLIWRLGSGGEIWWVWTSRYEIFRGSQSRSPVISRHVEPVPVSGVARDAAIEALDRFRSLGGRIDVSRIPRVQPALQSFFLDDADRIWTLLTTDSADRVMEIHDADGDLLGRFTIPVALRSSPQPVVRGNLLYGVEFDELDVPYVVVLRIDW